MARRLGDERGSTVVLVALSMTALLSMVALAVDVGMLLTVRTEAQRTADAAALAGAGVLIRNPNDEDGARQTAIQFGQQNIVHGDAPEILPEDVEIDLDRSRVTVTARRTAERGSAIATWFANVFGVSLVDVAARATAEAYPVGSAMCVKPFAIQDRFLDVNGDGYYDPGTDLYDPAVHGYGSSWRNPGQPGDDGQGYIDDFGRPVVLYGNDLGGGNDGDNPYPGTGPSRYYPWAMPQADGSPPNGAARYRWNIANCNPVVVSVGEEYDVEPGAMSGPTGGGTSDLMNQDPWATWNDQTMQVQNSAWDPAWEGSRRIGIVPVFAPAPDFDPGRQPVEFTNFIAVFFEGVSGNGNDQVVYGRILYPRGVGAATDDVAPFARSVRLVE